MYMATIPLSLYIHLPWCVRKCPYCDFNSHEAKESLPETLYVAALLQELDQQLPLLQNRPLTSIFFGGGTPSLFSGIAIAAILEGVAKRMAMPTEITLEANPGTIDQVKFHDFRQAGVNRLSLGIQSLQNDKLKILGRIHDRDHAIRAIELAKAAGFTNFNVDIMYGLPNQSIEDALSDVETALSFEPTHFSWYQLTIEPNTMFHHQPPALPVDDAIFEMQQAGLEGLAAAHFKQYEVSAYSLAGKECLHNRNYWEYGDYLGIGAGAHSKLTDLSTGEISRFAQVKHPKDYLDAAKRRALIATSVAEKDRAFEFMLNALRLTEGVPAKLFSERTGLSLSTINDIWQKAQLRGLMLEDRSRLCVSALGKRFLNDVVAMFL